MIKLKRLSSMFMKSVNRRSLDTSLNFSTEDAEKKAFGWIHSPYWSEERKGVPSAEVPRRDRIHQSRTNRVPCIIGEKTLPIR